MRPRELTVAGFRSHAMERTFDFRGRGLVGIVGPIGSGKSSLLDAISFALYGKTPTVQRGTKALIHQRSPHAQVTFDFEADGGAWRVVRLLRKQGASQHVLARLEGDGPGTVVTDEKVTGEGPVNDRIVELLGGLDFDAFGRSVMLAQGRFAEFLRARPGERDKVLKGVFRLERIDAMRAAARERLHEIDRELEGVRVRLEQFDQATTDLGARQGELAAARVRVEELEKAATRVAGQKAVVDEAGERARIARERLEKIGEAAKRLPDPKQTEKLLGRTEKADLEVTEATAAVQAAAAQTAQAAAALAKLDAATERERLDSCRQLLAARGPQMEAAARDSVQLRSAEKVLASVTTKLEDLEKRQRTGAESAIAAVGALDAAEGALSAAEADHHRALHADMAATLRTGLHEGEPCPVCSQTVATVPAPGAPGDLGAARDVLEKARRSRTEAARIAAAAGSEQERLEVELAATAERKAAAVASVQEAESSLKQQKAAVEGTEAELSRLLGSGDPDSLLKARTKQLELADDAVAVARRTEEEARGRHAGSVKLAEAVREETEALRFALVQAASGLEIDVAAGSSGAPGVRELLTTIQSGLTEAEVAAKEALTQADAGRTAGEQELARLLEQLDATDGYDAAMAKAAARVEHLEMDIERLTKQIEAGGKARSRAAILQTDREVFTRLAADLTDSHFVRFLLEAERARLADIGSEHFEQLSQGRYRFGDDGRFDIVDLAAAENTRKADSLSGGETFLASLALALALAEMVAREGGRLEAFFLDEGFGSLDSEHLDLAMDGIEALASGGSDRLVVVVSHVPELRDRLEDLIKLEKDPVTGDSIVVRA